jgi:ankyrin repeat protein
MYRKMGIIIVLIFCSESMLAMEEGGMVWPSYNVEMNDLYGFQWPHYDVQMQYEQEIDDLGFPFHEIARYKNNERIAKSFKECARWLGIEAVTKLIEKKDYDGNTAYDLACSNKNFMFFCGVVCLGIPIKFFGKSNDEECEFTKLMTKLSGYSRDRDVLKGKKQVIHVAVANNDAEVLRHLLFYMDVNVLDFFGNPPLYYCVRKNREAKLIETKSTEVSSRCEKNSKKSKVLSEEGADETLKVLLENGANPDLWVNHYPNKPGTVMKLCHFITKKTMEPEHFLNLLSKYTEGVDAHTYKSDESDSDFD